MKVKDRTEAHEKLKAELAAVKAKWDEAKKAMGDNSDEANKLGLVYYDVDKAVNASAAEFKKLESQHTQFGKSVTKAAAELLFYADKENEAKDKAGEFMQALD